MINTMEQQKPVAIAASPPRKLRSCAMCFLWKVHALAQGRMLEQRLDDVDIAGIHSDVRRLRREGVAVCLRLSTPGIAPKTTPKSPFQDYHLLRKVWYRFFIDVFVNKSDQKTVLLQEYYEKFAIDFYDVIIYHAGRVPRCVRKCPYCLDIYHQW